MPLRSIDPTDSEKRWDCTCETRAERAWRKNRHSYRWGDRKRDRVERAGTTTQEVVRFRRHCQGWEYRDTGRPLSESDGKIDRSRIQGQTCWWIRVLTEGAVVSSFEKPHRPRYRNLHVHCPPTRRSPTSDTGYFSHFPAACY
jgi:hypothetical protein